MKKILSAALVPVLLCCLLTGCGEKEKVQITVKVPVLVMNCVNDPECGDTSVFIRKAFDRFAAQYDKYDVSADIIVFEQTGYQEAIPDCYGQENGADLTFGGYFTISCYMYDGYAVPLDDVITDEIRADFSESSWAQSKGNNGKTYLMPFYALQNILCYNKALFRQCGLDEYCYDDREIRSWSLEEWDTILSTLAEKLPDGCCPR